MNQEQSTEFLNQMVARFFRIYVRTARIYVSPDATGGVVLEALGTYGEARRAIEYLCAGGASMSNDAIWDAGEAALKAIGEPIQ